MKPKITVAWEHLGAVGGMRNDSSKWTVDRSILWVRLWSDRLKRVDRGVYRYTLCEDGDVQNNISARHHANVDEAIERGVPMRGFLVWPKKELNAQGLHAVEDVDPTRQYEVEVESRNGTVIVALAKGLQ